MFPPPPTSTEREPLLLLGIDLGATFVKLGLVSSSTGLVAHKARLALTSWSQEGVVKLLLDGSKALLQEAGKSWGDVAAIGIGSPGQVRDGNVVAAANFPTWKDVPLAKIFHEATGKPTALVNDADAAVSAEVWVGAAGGRQNAAILTLGSGVGCGVVINGKVLSGSRGLIEAGHMIVQLNGRQCACGQKGCLETYASANAVATRAIEAIQASEEEESVLRVVLRERGVVTAKDVFEAAAATAGAGAEGVIGSQVEEGDALAARVVQETADFLAMGCLNICRIIDPEVIIFAGGMAEAGEQLLLKVRASFQKLGWVILNNEVEMVVASLGPDTGLIGAAACARFLLLDSQSEAHG